MKLFANEDIHNLQEATFRLKLSSFCFVISKMDSLPSAVELADYGGSCLSQCCQSSALLGAYILSAVTIRQSFTTAFSKWIRTVFTEASQENDKISKHDIETVSKFAEHINIFTGSFASNSFLWPDITQPKLLRTASLYPVQLNILEMCCQNLVDSVNFLLDFGANHSIPNITSIQNAVMEEVNRKVVLDFWWHEILKAITRTNEVAWVPCCKIIKEQSEHWHHMSLRASLRCHGLWKFVRFVFAVQYHQESTDIPNLVSSVFSSIDDIPVSQ